MTLSIVIPVYNEEKNLPELWEQIRATVVPLGIPWDVTFVDDGSRDQSVSVLKHIQTQEPEHAQVIVLNRNFGQTAAISAGIDHSKGDIVILMDSDLKGVLLIPQKATFEVLDHRYVYVIGKDSVLRTTRIGIGPELQHLFVVNEGLNKDDRILLEGLRKVKDGEKVDYAFIAPDSVVKHLDLYAE